MRRSRPRTGEPPVPPTRRPGRDGPHSRRALPARRRRPQGPGRGAGAVDPLEAVLHRPIRGHLPPIRGVRGGHGPGDGGRSGLAGVAFLALSGVPRRGGARPSGGLRHLGRGARLLCLARRPPAHRGRMGEGRPRDRRTAVALGPPGRRVPGQRLGIRRPLGGDLTGGRLPGRRQPLRSPRHGGQRLGVVRRLVRPPTTTWWRRGGTRPAPKGGACAWPGAAAGPTRSPSCAPPTGTPCTRRTPARAWDSAVPLRSRAGALAGAAAGRRLPRGGRGDRSRLRPRGVALREPGPLPGGRRPPRSAPDLPPVGGGPRPATTDP